MNRASLVISALEIRSPVAPDQSPIASTSGYIFEYFDNDVIVNGPFGSAVCTEPVCMLYSLGEVSIENVSKGGSRTWFFVHGDELEACLHRYEIPVNQVLVGPFGSLVIIPSLQEVRRLTVQRGRYWGDEVSLMCRRFFRNLARAILQRGERATAVRHPQESFSSLRHIRARIHADLRRHWTTDEMAKQAHISPSYYQQLYTSYFHISPIEDLIRARIRQAKLLLRFSNLTIDQIAEECGFSNATAFYRVFRKRCGATPGEYVSDSRTRDDMSRALPPVRRSNRIARSKKRAGIDELSFLYGEPAGYWNFDLHERSFDQDYRFHYEPMKLLHGARSVESPWGGALDLDGNLAYGEIAEAVVDTSQSFTICAWVMIYEGAPAYDWMTAISIGGENHCSCCLQYSIAEDRFAFTMTQSSTNFETIHAQGSTGVVKEAWVHVCGVHDRETGVISLWENGRRSSDTHFGAAWTGAGPTRFGAGVYWGQITDFWQGRVAEAKFYARALNADEIMRVYHHRLPSVRQIVQQDRS